MKPAIKQTSTGLIRNFFYEAFSLVCFALILIGICVMLYGLQSTVSTV